MRQSGVCVAVVLWLCTVSREALTITNSSSCVETFRCFDIEYPECVKNTSAIVQPVNVLIGSRRGSLLDIDDFSQLLTELVCHHLNRSTPPPLCWSFTQSNATSECNRTLAEVGIFEVAEGGSLQLALSRDSFIQLLQSSPSFFAVAGYTLTTIQGESGSESSSGLFDVPLLSWIMVGIGILSSLVFLTKPVWWDRIIMKCWQYCEQK